MEEVFFREKKRREMGLNCSSLITTTQRRSNSPRGKSSGTMRCRSWQRVEIPTCDWVPNGNCVWTSVSGLQVTLRNTSFQTLTTVEFKILQRIVTERIEKLNIGFTAETKTKVPQNPRFALKKPIKQKPAPSNSNSTFYDTVAETCLNQCQMDQYLNLNEENVPPFIIKCIEKLEANGLHAVGLFRVGASQRRLKEMRERFDKYSIAIIDLAISPHDVATLLKEFLRDLPEPLICHNLYKAFIKTQQIEDKKLKVEVLSYLVYLLPPFHLNTLFVLLKFLWKVASHSDDVSHPDGTNLEGNKMNSKNLAMVFAPNIMRCAPSEEQEFGHMTDRIGIVSLMIDNHDELFHVPAELLDQIYVSMSQLFPEELNLIFKYRKMRTRNETARKLSSDKLLPVKEDTDTEE